MLNIVVLDYGDTCHKSAGRAKASKSSVLVFAWLTLLRFQPFVRENTCGLHSAIQKKLAFACSLFMCFLRLIADEDAVIVFV